MKNKGIIRIIGLILALLLLVYLWKETSWNFTFLGFLGIFLVFLAIKLPPLFLSQDVEKNGKLGSFYRVYGLKDRIPEKLSPVKNTGVAWWASLLIVIFTICTFFTLANYFYADEKVYTNNEHHALRVDGVLIKEPKGFTLVQNDRNAFFDSDGFNGSVVIEDFDEEGVTLAYNGFTHPIYKQTGSKDSLLNSLSSVISFQPNEIVTFKNKREESIEFKFVDYGAESSKKNIFKSEKDSAEYFFRRPGSSDWEKSSVTTLFVRGYSFSDLLNGKDIDAEGFDFNGINIARAYSFPRAKNYERADEGGTQYILDINRLAWGDEEDKDKISRITVGGKTIDLSDKNYFSGRIKVGYKTEKSSNNILFGYGEEATLPFSFSLDTTRNTLTMNFKMALYRQLYCVKDKKVNSLYVTNSLIKDLKLENGSEIGVNAPDNVLLFDFFDKWDNVNMFKPFNLFFTAGSTMERMTVLCDANDEDRAYKAGEQIEGISSEGDGGVEWHLSIENLRDSTPFGTEKMLWVVWIVAFCSFITINFHNLFGGSRNIYKYHRNAFSYAEFAAYMAIIYFVAFRCFLLWRTSVFRPLENISKFELETIFYNEEHFYYLLACIAVFYVVILVVKALLLHGFKSEKRRTIKDIINKDPIYARLVYYIEKVRGLLVGKLFFVIVPLLYVTSALLALITDSRKGLLAIMLSYFVADILINIRSKQWTVEKNDDTSPEETVEDAVSSFIYSLGNMLLTGGVMVVINDTGFLIMFATYCLLAFCIKLRDLYVRIHNQGKSLYILWLYLVASVILILAFLKYKEIIIGAIYSKFLILVPVLAFALLLLFIGRFAGVLKFVHRFPFLKWNGKPITVAWYATLVGIVVGVIMFASGTTLSDHLGKHTLQRINVQLYEPHEALAMTESKLDELRFLQASHNHFIIEQYYDKSREVTLFGEQGEGFLKMQPQSKLGAMWNAQVTDIVLLRYVITEHARILPLIFLALILLMFYYGMRETTYFRFTKSLLVQIPLLLFVQGWLVWLANTQRFVFFGQDFPLLSITAKVMIVYVFVLLLIWVLAAILEAIMCRTVWHFDDKLKQNTYKPLNDFNRVHSGWISFFGIVILVSSYFFAEPVAKDKEGRYNMATLFKPEGAGKYIAKIDSLFVNYQKDIRQSGKQAMSLRRNMHSQIQTFENIYGDSIRTLFVSEALNQLDTTEYKFPLRIWQNYVSSGSYNNSSTGLLHVYNKNGVLRLATRTSYYDLTLPIRESDVWKNHIVENYSPTHNHDTIIKDGGKKSYVYYQLPENWVREGQTLHLLKKWQTDDLNVVSLGDNQRISLAGAEFNNSIALDAGDYVYVGEDRIETLPLENRNYWARNILVNGKRQFIYPQGEAMFWMKGFAEVVKDSLNDKDGDVPVTLNRDLSVALYEILKSSSSQKSNDFNSRSVIVADGKGHIRAMVDYKRNYELDPNDGERIDSLTEALYMNQKGNNRAEESDYLENRNLAHMRGGPGSSQKPLVWNAVASAVDFNWKDLILYRIYPDLLEDNNGVRGLTQYNGGRMKTNKYQPADELDGNKDITLTSFLARSSNYYSALMVYLGLHNMSTYKDKNVFIPLPKDDKTQGSIFKYYTAPNLLNDTAYQANYPFIKIGANGRTMTLNKKISYLDYNRSVLHHQFTDVMGLYDHNVSQEFSRLAYNLYPKYLGGNINGFLTPATSSLNLALFKEVETRGPNNENNGMRNISLGGAEFWAVTPLKMAEMYGKVVSLNKEFTLSLDPNCKNVIEEWIPSGKYYYDARPMMFKGMNLFFTDVDGYKGNGNGIVLKNDVSGESVGSKTINGKTYYFYGKTGTAHNDGYKRTKQNTLVTEKELNVLYRQGGINKIKEFLDEEDFTITNERIVKIKKVDEFRRLAIIITDRDLQTVDMNDLENVKFYTLFFTYDYKTSDLRETSRKVINEVLYSKVFNDYMNN